MSKFLIDALLVMTVVEVLVAFACLAFALPSNIRRHPLLALQSQIKTTTTNQKQVAGDR